MPDMIVDGTGSGNKARVNDDNHLLVAAIAESEFEFISHTKGLAFSWSSSFATGGSDIEVLSLATTSSTSHVHVSEIIFSTDTNTKFTVFKVTSGTPAGTILTPTNLNVGIGITAPSTSFGNASVTGSLSGDVILPVRVIADDTKQMMFLGALLIQQGEAIAVTSSVSATVEVTILGYFEDNHL